MPGYDLAAYAMDVLDHLEKSRQTSQAFTEGTLQGALKKGYQTLEKVIKTFAIKSTFRGDPEFYKNKLDAQQIELKKLKDENAYLKKEIAQIKKDFADLKKQHPVRITRGRIQSSTSPSAERMTIVPDIDYFIQQDKDCYDSRNVNDFPPLPPFRREPNTKIRNRGKPLPPPSSRRPEDAEEVVRIEKQIAALKAAKDKIVSGNKNLAKKDTRNLGKPGTTKGKTLPRPRESSAGRTTSTEEGWTRVGDKRKKRRKSLSKNNTTDKVRTNTGRRINEVAKVPVRRRPPRSSVVAIKALGGTSYAGALRKIKQEMNLSDFGIETLQIRKAANRSTLLKISGVDNATKADKLAEKVQEVLGVNAKVTRPTKRADLRIYGFDESVTTTEIKTVVSELGCCRF